MIERIESSTAKGLALRLAQECVSRAPVILLGSGASAAEGIPGVGPLGEHLLRTTPQFGDEGASRSWEAFCRRLESSGDLEDALSHDPHPEAVVRHIVETTWDFLTPYDIGLLAELVGGARKLALTRLFDHLFATTRDAIHVVTPNYDRVAEYAADMSRRASYTGFSSGFVRRQAPTPAPGAHRLVNVWKVHGSLDWFYDSDSVVLALPPSSERPCHLLPAIVTPGIEKYHRTHLEPFRSIQRDADLAIERAQAFLCVGYGFNDEHVQTKVVERCRRTGTHLGLVTKVVSSTAHVVLRKCQRYFALEESEGASRLFCNEFPDGVVVDEPGLWTLDGLLRMVTA